MSLSGNKPNQKRSVGTGILSGLCVASAVMIFSLTNCTPVELAFYPLQGNNILLQGNEFLTPYNGDAINTKLMLAKYRDNRYDEVLLKNNSGRASRRYLAFYVADSSMDSQIHPNQSDTAHQRFKRQWGSSTLMFMVADGRAPTLYEGKTSLNKIAFGRISGAVAIVAESDSSHPIFSYSVIPTQKTIGAIHHG